MADQDSGRTEFTDEVHDDNGRSQSGSPAGSDSPRRETEYAAMYELLQVAPHADVEVMRRVFCFLAEKHHQNETPDAAYGMWKKILNAWNVLSNKDGQHSAPSTMTHYHVLQVSPQAELGVISEAYHFLLLKYHPDNKATGDPMKLQMISDAWNVLSDTNLRLDYDKTLQR